MTVKPHFDVEKSLKMCPPRQFKGARFVKRIVINRDKVTFPEHEQTRVLSVKQDNVISIRDSLSINGWIHTEQPPFGYVDPNNKDRFVGISGYNRDAAMSQLEWQTMIFDVYEFDSPLAKRIAKTSANQHRTPFSPNTKEDLVKQVISAIKENEIDDNQKSIKDLIAIIADDKTDKEKKIIYDTVMKRKGGSDTIRTYHTGKGEYSTEEIAIDLKLPYKGDAHLKLSGELGYIGQIKTPKTVLFDAKVMSSTYNNAKVAFLGFIDKPGEQPKIYEQRKQFQNDFEKFIRQDAKFVLNILKTYGVKTTLDEVLGKYPIYFKGFLPQVITPDANKGGRPKEETLVDALGNQVV
jgi:hypothetical protein